jgi:hypothetical protein
MRAFSQNASLNHMGSLLKFSPVTAKKQTGENLVVQRKKVMPRPRAKTIKSRLYTRFLGALVL